MDKFVSILMGNMIILTLQNKEIILLQIDIWIFLAQTHSHHLTITANTSTRFHSSSNDVQIEIPLLYLYHFPCKLTSDDMCTSTR